MSGEQRKKTSKNEELQNKLFAVVKTEKDTTIAKVILRNLIETSLDSVTRSNPQALEAAISTQVKRLNSSWFRFFLTYDPRPALKKVRCPVVAIGGEKDLQVCPKQNLPEIELALRAGGNKDFTAKELPRLNHIFQTASTGVPAEYGKIEETISPMVLKLIADWILEKTR